MKRFFAAFLCLILILPLIPASSAAFEGEEKINIVIDPGHGGSNVGTSRGGIAEKTCTYELALLLKEKLEANGNFNVYMTRTGDYDLTLAERCIYANTVNADLLVSLHFDGSNSSYDRGVSVITSVLPEYAMASLASSVASSVSSATGMPSRGVVQKKDTEGYYWNYELQWDCKDSSLGTLSDYYSIPTWCAKFGIGSILIEHGFFTNSSDAAIIFADGTFEKMAQADADAIIAYYTNHTHSYEATPIRDFPSNCMYTGKQSIHCTVCGHRKNITSLAAAPDRHYWINETSKAVSCGVDGYVTHECRITQSLLEKDVSCTHHKETVYIEAEPHSYYVSDTREVSHAVDGYYQYTCSKCDHTYKEMIYAEGHSWALTKETSPTCSEVGSLAYICEGCGETKTEELPALGHSITVTESVAATCTEEGYEKSYCSACGEDFEETSEPLGHNNTVTVLREASCTEDGEVHTVCNNCGYEEVSSSPAKGHTVALEDEQEVSCEEGGYAKYICTVCGYEEKQEYTAAGHNYTHSVTARATFFKNGTKLFTCENCGKKYDEAILSGWNSHAVKLTVCIVTVLAAVVASSAVMIVIKKKKAAESAHSESIVDGESSDAVLVASEKKSPEVDNTETAEVTSEEEISGESEEKEGSAEDELPVG